MEEKRVHFEVHGVVQGVGYRYFARKKAQSYGIKGWCRNTPAGTVEGEAQADAPALQLFFADLNTGPSHAAVTKVTQDAMRVIEGEGLFEVRR